VGGLNGGRLRRGSLESEARESESSVEGARTVEMKRDEMNERVDYLQYS